MNVRFPSEDANAEDNYLKKLHRMQAEGDVPAGPGLWRVVTAHDDWCGALKAPPTRCGCDPDIRFFDVHGNPWRRER